MTRLFIIPVLVSIGSVALMVGAAKSAPAAPSSAGKPATGVAHGHEIFVSYGCYQCHGYQGQGSGAGPKLAPGMLPIGVFTHQLRNPRNVMPVYTARTVSQGDLADMYAYLQTIPKAKSVAELPLLNQ